MSADLASWLQALGLDQYASVFADNGVDLDALRLLSEADLQALGVLLGHRRKLLRAIADLDGGAAAAAPQTVPSVPVGEPVRSDAERRQLTVMFCDLVGSTALSQRLDPEELRRLIRQYQDACVGAITRFEGHVAQYLGDGVLAYFGYPVALEGGAERAIRAGLAVIERVGEFSAQRDQPLQVRIGIDTGLVVIGQGEALSEQERTAVGDAPNIAARLQGLAAPGSVVISERTRQLAPGDFNWRDLGAHALKGITEPVHAWQVAGERASETRFDAATGGLTAPMVGREMELDLALRAWQQAHQGKLQVLLLCGEGGIGKSRIVRALRERLSAEGAQPWQYQCSPYFINSALYPIIAHMERALRFERDEPAEARLAKLEARVIGELGRPGLDVNLIGRLFNLPVEAKYGPLAMSPQKQKDETLRALADLVQVASRAQPLLVLFEDVHWADPTTLEAVDQLLKRDDTRALVVMTYRPEFRPAWIGQPHVTALTLGRLDPEQIEAVVTRVAGGKPLPKEIVAQIVAKTDGVPLFVEELTKAILESNLVEDKGDRYELAGPLLTLAIPNSLRDSLMARLDRLAPVKEVAQIGACIGREFSDELVALVSPLPRSELTNALEQLTASELVYKRGAGKEAVYVFKHALVQDAAYDSLLKSRRAEVHAKIARALEKHFPDTAANEPELLAQHYTAAGSLEQAIGYWKRAGELAHTRIALQEAIAHLERGLALTLTLPSSQTRDRHELELRGLLGMAWIALQGWSYPAVAEHLGPAYALEEALTPGEHSLRVLWGLWVYRLATGQTRESLSIAEELLAQGRLRGDEDRLQAGLWAAVTTHYWLGQFEKSIEHADLILERYDPVRHHGLADALNHDPKTVALQYKAASQGMLGYPDSAKALMKATLEHARARNHAFDLAWALFFAVYQLHGVQRDANAIDMLLAELELLAREQRLLVFEHVLGPYCRAIRNLICNATEDADNLLNQIIPTLKAGQLNALIAKAKIIQARCAIALHKPARALVLADEAIALLTQPGADTRYVYSEGLRVKGVALEAMGRISDAEAALKSAIDAAQAQKALWWELRAATSLARLWQSQGKRMQAYELLAPVYNWFTEGFDTKDLQEAKTLLDELRWIGPNAA
jgi:class 3 adenylate cyclase/tetratricopeptide (TPR) repeat protein